MRKFILGTDWWTDCDDVVAMRLLLRAHKKGEVELKGVAVNACMEYSVASVDGFLNQEGVSDIPIGIDLQATDFGGNPSYQRRGLHHLRSGIAGMRTQRMLAGCTDGFLLRRGSR